ncbi:MAG: cation transporter [Gammaproteobacteria bacterium]|nr:cation transporter [Gammaproteobacteria bacterium]NIR98088.1 cation transporter [Gammaproteobacteria bacterium]NIT63426.1 cation transporter [Gammaproteobacteria bacterium]NIV20333.1 cation diffusion facilitator family transporter [Gammaproteobacteria bacterium]NIX10810.1 cation diffusion facilitator family transporter [Gammaproteobacteria bacterium]
MSTGPIAPPGAGERRYAEARKVTVVGAVVDLVLGLAKVVAGLTSHSQALIADGIHSFSDLITDGMVLFAAKHASREADEDHPYGHARIETVVTVALGAALVAVALGLAYDATRRLFHPELLLHPGWPALAVAGLSIVAKEGIYHYTMRAARRLRSNLLRANAWHSRTDAVSSIIVVVGVAGAMAGLDYLDAIAAVGVAIMIAKIGWDLAWHSVRELVDEALDAERVSQIRKAIHEVGGVRDLHLLRTRRMGGDALVDVHIQVDPRLSVSEGHQVSESVRSRLIAKFEEISDVMVHIDPENDEVAQPWRRLPLRAELMRELNQAWGDLPGADRVEKVTLHYLSGAVDVELVLPLAVVEDLGGARRLAESYKSASRAVPEVGHVQVQFR